MNLRWHLIASHVCSGIRSVAETCRCSRIALVVLHKFLEVVRLACITLDAFHDAFTADGAVIRDVVVHAAVVLGAEYATAVHIGSLKDIHDIAVSVIEDKVAPRNFIHLAGKGEVVVPAEIFGIIHGIYVPAASAITEVDKCIVVDILITQFPETVSTCFVLNHTACIKRITVGTHGAEGNG